MKHAMTRLRLPEGGAARLYPFSFLPDFPWAMFVGSNPDTACPDAVTRGPGISFGLALPSGAAWPAWEGERLAAEALARGCVLVLAFADLADALRCKARLEGGSA